MSLYQNLVQFAPTPALGQPLKGPQPGTLPVRINPASVATGLQVGTPLYLIASSSPEIVVDLWTPTVGQPIFGVIPLNTKKNKYSAGDLIDLFTDGNILLLESTAAISRGALVTVGNTAATGGCPGVTTTTTQGAAVLGQALTQTSAAQQLVAIKIKTGTYGGTVLDTGTFTANGATAVVVADANVYAGCQIAITLLTVGGTPAGAPFLSAITPGTGFSVKAVAGDTSIYQYRIS